MSVGDITRLLQRYDVAEVARMGTGENAVRFRRNRQNLLGRENQARVRAGRLAPKPPRYHELPTGQGVVTGATNWGFGGGVDWEDSPVYLNADVDPRNMHVRHVIPYEIIEGEIKRGRQENPFNRTRFDIGQVRRLNRPSNKR